MWLLCSVGGKSLCALSMLVLVSTAIVLFIYCRWEMEEILFASGSYDGQARIWNTTVTYHLFHWKKGIPFPFAVDQGIYNRLTWWEQIDSGKQLNRHLGLFTRSRSLDKNDTNSS
ncbi:hypothetical protein L6452_01467 [Arctium lappa]|uniref:Uncharacterized protein n=1 Tax=Arctium lappa TaxID=4217 RepID=A0ACB9FGF0_ARCLA|nr:hypothetical protein L6452_01467 [Arctium lappa]